jgi:hypothetical protein
VSRDPNVMIDGSVYALTAITAVRPGREPLLRERLRALRCPDSPFARLPSTHFARFVVLDRLAFEGPPAARPAIGQQYLLFSSTFDGEASEARDAYLEHMCRRVPETVDEIFGLCAGAPAAAEPERFRDWIVSHQVRTRAFFAHDATAKVGDVLAACALSAAVRSFALKVPYARPDVLQREFEQTFRR